jgi:hypothetical protein
LLVAVNGNTLVVWTSSGEQLSVDASNTIFFVPGVPNASLSNIHIGQTIRVIGSRNGNNVTAQLVTNAALANPAAVKKGNKPGLRNQPGSVGGSV